MTAPANTAELKRLAEAATPGPWQNGIDDLEGVVSLGSENDGNVICLPPSRLMVLSLEEWPDNAAYIAAANPEAILSLISTIERLAEENAGLREGLIFATTTLYPEAAFRAGDCAERSGCASEICEAIRMLASNEQAVLERSACALSHAKTKEGA